MASSSFDTTTGACLQEYQQACKRPVRPCMTQYTACEHANYVFYRHARQNIVDLCEGRFHLLFCRDLYKERYTKMCLLRRRHVYDHLQPEFMLIVLMRHCG